jgi:hypothetical protein
MSFNIRTLQARQPLARLAGVAVILAASAASVAAAPLTANPDPADHAYSQKSAQEKRESVEDRIATLHSSLMITLDEEQDWAAVAQVMRANEATMEALVAKERARPARTLTAVQDMRTYETFTAAHVTGLASLISSFEVLYAAMPAPQQAVADQVFQNFGHKA